MIDIKSCSIAVIKINLNFVQLQQKIFIVEPTRQQINSIDKNEVCESL